MLVSANANPLIPPTPSYDHKRSESNRLESTTDLRIRLKTGTKILKGIQGLLSGFQGKVATSYLEPELRHKTWDRIFKNIFADFKELEAKITPEIITKENNVPVLNKLHNRSAELLESLENIVSKTLHIYENEPLTQTTTPPSFDLQNFKSVLREICDKELMNKVASRIVYLKEKIDFFGPTPDCNSLETKRFAAYVSEFIPDFMVKQAINIRVAKNERVIKKYNELRTPWMAINCNLNQINFNLQNLTTYSTVLSHLRTSTLILKENIKSINIMHEVMNSILPNLFSKNLAKDKKSEGKRDINENITLFNSAVQQLSKLGELCVEKNLEALKTYKVLNQLTITTEIEAIDLNITNAKIFKPNDIDDRVLDMELTGQRDVHIQKLISLKKRILEDWNNFCFYLTEAEFNFNIFDLTINHIAAITDSYLKADNIMQEMRFTRLKNRNRSEHIQAHQIHSNTYEKMRASLLKEPIKQYFKGTRGVTHLFTGDKGDKLQVNALLLEEIAKLTPRIKPQDIKDNKLDADTENLIKFGCVWDSDETKDELTKKFKNLREVSAKKLSHIQSVINTTINVPDELAALPDILATAANELNRVSTRLETTNCIEMAGYDDCFNDVYTRENQAVGTAQNFATSGLILAKKLWSGAQPNEREQHKHIEIHPIL